MAALVWTALLMTALATTHILGQEEEKTGTDTGIWCFQCHSGTDPDCDDLTKDDKKSRHYKDCNQQDKPVTWNKPENDTRPYFCRKIVQTIHDLEGKRVVIRKCGWVRDPRNQSCYTVSSVGHKDIVCQCWEDGCNPGHHFTPLFGLLIAALLGLRLL